MKHSPQQHPVLFWFRRDLRLDDNVALCHALQSGHHVIPLFIFDSNILDSLSDRSDKRVQFICKELVAIKAKLEQKYDTTLIVRYGEPHSVLTELCEMYSPAGVYANEDYEPYAITRDNAIAGLLEKSGIHLHLFKDHVIFAKDEVTKADGKPYTVFTPYRKRWLDEFRSVNVLNHSISDCGDRFATMPSQPMPSLKEIGFEYTEQLVFPPRRVHSDLLRAYAGQREYPSISGTSGLGIHLRFGTISIRRLVMQARLESAVFLSELIWREFFQQILWHYPEVVQNNFRPQYDGIVWRNDEQEFQAWCQGMTGYPLVDAGMRELNATGQMHNRVRMVVASFLTKHLLIDWRWGEAYFASRLLDYDLASNNGNWQWAAGTGCDAAPYFRIFNPVTQAARFDPEQQYIRKWIPEIGTTRYPTPIVEHGIARARALKAYRGSVQSITA